MTSAYWLQTHSVGADDVNLVTSSIGRSLDVGTETSAYDVQTTSGLQHRKSTIFRRRNYRIGNTTFIRRRFVVGRLIKPMADTTHRLCIRGTHKITTVLHVFKTSTGHTFRALSAHCCTKTAHVIYASLFNTFRHKQ